MDNKIKIVALILAITIVVGLIGYVGYGIYLNNTFEIENPIVTMEIEGYGTVKIELYPDQAPNTVANFITLANNGFYNGLTFHRTIPEFMVQGGATNGDGTTSPMLSNIYEGVVVDKEYNIEGEFLANGVNNTLKHEKGIISMARTDYSQYDSSLTVEGYNSVGSQFFIMTENNYQLDGYYAAFGKVIEGLDIIEEISNVDVIYRTEDLGEDEEAPVDEDDITISSDTPVEQPVMTSVSVETFGVEYGAPKTNDVFDIQEWFTSYYGMSF